MRTLVQTPDAPKLIGPFSQAVVNDNFVFVSAQFAQDLATGKMILDNIEAETTKVMDNIQSILQAAGLDFTHVVKCSIFLKDMEDYPKVNAIYSSYLKTPFPARETIQVAGLPLNVNIEISAIAMRN